MINCFWRTLDGKLMCYWLRVPNTTWIHTLSPGWRWRYHTKHTLLMMAILKIYIESIFYKVFNDQDHISKQKSTQCNLHFSTKALEIWELELSIYYYCLVFFARVCKHCKKSLELMFLKDFRYSFCLRCIGKGCYYTWRKLASLPKK